MPQCGCRRSSNLPAQRYHWRPRAPDQDGVRTGCDCVRQLCGLVPLGAGPRAGGSTHALSCCRRPGGQARRRRGSTAFRGSCRISLRSRRGSRSSMTCRAAGVVTLDCSARSRRHARLLRIPRHARPGGHVRVGAPRSAGRACQRTSRPCGGSASGGLCPSRRRDDRDVPRFNPHHPHLCERARRAARLRDGRRHPRLRGHCVLVEPGMPRMDITSAPTELSTVPPC